MNLVDYVDFFNFMNLINLIDFFTSLHLLFNSFSLFLGFETHKR